MVAVVVAVPGTSSVTITSHSYRHDGGHDSMCEQRLWYHYGKGTIIVAVVVVVVAGGHTATGALTLTVTGTTRCVVRMEAVITTKTVMM